MNWLSRNPADVARELTSKATFPATVRLLAINIGAEVSEVDEDEHTAMLALGGKAAGYGLFVSLTEDGGFLAVVASRAKWPGRAPAAAHGVMQRLDRDSDRVTFTVHTFESGKSRCVAQCVGKTFTTLTSGSMAGVVDEMARGMRVADEVLEEGGYA